MPPSTSTPAGPTPVGSPAAVSAKLSPRLQRLADLAASGTLAVDAAGQSSQLGLAPSGGGSLARDNGGLPLIEVRVADTSPAALTELTARGANVVSIAPRLATVTLGIDPRRLLDLAALSNVQYMTEALTPATNR
ncbi:MAG TPA: hypothetical protein VJB57_11920 [Dehalococcoidia bacterium]|nr:hypothetical protein [Dehalococcoidia bacterium]